MERKKCYILEECFKEVVRMCADGRREAFNGCDHYRTDFKFP